MVGLIAIGVLLLITNWFFHKVYWTEWIAQVPPPAQALEQLDGARLRLRAGRSASRCSGFTSVYREGFETVLFLQSLELSAGHRDRARGRRRSASR